MSGLRGRETEGGGLKENVFHRFIGSDMTGGVALLWKVSEAQAGPSGSLCLLCMDQYIEYSVVSPASCLSVYHHAFCMITIGPSPRICKSALIKCSPYQSCCGHDVLPQQ